MELYQIESLLEKYFEGESSLAGEKMLQEYFSRPDVAPHLQHYKPMFGYFSSAREESLPNEIVLAPGRRNRSRSWLSIAASVAVLITVGTFAYREYAVPKDLGTYDDPGKAFRETQKALALLSDNVNTGVESVAYLKEYEASKNRIFNYQINQK